MNVMDMFSLRDRVAVVTGAGSGLGRCIAEAMAEAGASVVCADFNENANRETAARVEAIGLPCMPVTCDVTDAMAVAQLFSQAHSRFGRIDIAFANAGIADPSPGLAHEYALENWKTVIDVNLNGVFYTCREALRYMFKAGQGKLITTASMWGLAGASSVAPIPAYNAAKGAVVNLTRELALEYAPYNIQINALCPGFFLSRLANDCYEDDAFVKAATDFTPMGRIAQTHEIKGTALYLASDASSFTTGTTIVADGGCLAK